ncbi:MAG: tyrosine-type recombinase/integrase [Bacteroidales bacterium]|nr:tyrosine-type recombinase/integrase [Candidatus Scybalousia scybalohippi]
MKIEKLPSGSYRIQPYINGKRKSFTFDHRPTKKEIDDTIYNARNKDSKNVQEMTFRSAAELYNSSKENVISPATLKSYSTYPDRFPKWFVDMKICDIKQSHLNRLVNELSKGRAPKTVQNYHGYVHSVMKIYAPETTVHTNLPKNTKKDFYIPDADDIKAIICEAKGTEMEIPLALALYGLRRSEIFSVSKESIKDNVLIINKKSVLDKNNKMVELETTKTSASTRAIPISPYLAQKIIDEDWHWQGYDGKITRWLEKTEKRLGIEKFTLHKMRHYFASKLSDPNEMNGIKVSEADIMALGGWSTPHIMKAVYRHAMMKDKKKREITDQLTDGLFN